MESSLFPTISVDRSWGDETGNVAIDAEAIGRYLQRRGLTDEQITNLTILLAHHDETRTTVNDVHKRIFGRMHYDKNLIEIRRPSQAYLDDTGFLISGRLTGTLIHELEHYIASFDPGMAEAQNEFSTMKAERREQLLHGSMLYRELKRDAIFAYAIGGYVLAACVSAPNNTGEDFGIMGVEAAVGLAALGVHEVFRTRRINRKVKRTMYHDDPGEVRSFAAQRSYNGVNLITVTDLKNEAEPVTINNEFPPGFFRQACTRAKEFLATVIRRNADPADNAQ